MTPIQDFETGLDVPGFHVTTAVADAQDGLTRLLGDLGRFGSELTSVDSDNTDRQGRLQMRFIVDWADPEIVSTRLSRHPRIIWLEATKSGIADTPQEKG